MKAKIVTPFKIIFTVIVFLCPSAFAATGKLLAEETSLTEAYFEEMADLPPPPAKLSCSEANKGQEWTEDGKITCKKCSGEGCLAWKDDYKCRTIAEGDQVVYECDVGPTQTADGFEFTAKCRSFPQPNAPKPDCCSLQHLLFSNCTITKTKKVENETKPVTKCEPIQVKDGNIIVKCRFYRGPKYDEIQNECTTTLRDAGNGIIEETVECKTFKPGCTGPDTSQCTVTQTSSCKSNIDSATGKKTGKMECTFIGIDPKSKQTVITEHDKNGKVIKRVTITDRHSPDGKKIQHIECTYEKIEGREPVVATNHCVNTQYDPELGEPTVISEETTDSEFEEIDGKEVQVRTKTKKRVQNENGGFDEIEICTKREGNSLVADPDCNDWKRVHSAR